MNFVFCEWVLYVGTAPEQKTESAKDGKDSMSLPSFQSLRVQQVAPTDLHLYTREANRFIYFIWRGSAALSVSYLIIVPMVLGAIPAAFASSVSMCIARA